MNNRMPDPVHSDLRGFAHVGTVNALESQLYITSTTVNTSRGVVCSMCLERGPPVGM